MTWIHGLTKRRCSMLGPSWLVTAFGTALMLSSLVIAPVSAADPSSVPAVIPAPRTSPTPAPTPSPAPALTPAPTPSPTPAPTPGGPPDDAVFSFHSRPDLRPPRLAIESTEAAGSESLFITPRFGGEGEGLMIYDAAGELLWLRRVPGRTALDLRPITYDGAPALSWWEGVIDRGLGDGEYVIADRSYQEIARLRAEPFSGDLHEFLVTPEGTAYVFALDRVEIDGKLIDDYLVQELDIGTGKRLWQWRASDHIPLDGSVVEVPDDSPWDYLHLNSIALDGNGDLILSGRHTDTIYKVSRETGEIVWRLGGAESDYELPADAVFHRQHDARWHADGTISLFDNATDDAKDPTQPRGLVLRLDEGAGTAELARELAPPHRTNSSSQGNLMLEEDGTATIGWGSSNLVTGYEADGNVVFDGAMPAGFSSYRAYRAPWTGLPLDDPLVSVERDSGRHPMAWVSWNGATGVSSWRLFVGDREEALRKVGDTPRAGFETAIELPDDAAVVVIAALDAEGRPLGSSQPVVVEAALATPASTGE